MGCCTSYANNRRKNAGNLLDVAIYNDDSRRLYDIIKYTDGITYDYIFKPQMVSKGSKMSLINYASRCDSIDCVKMLLYNGANPNIYDSNGWLPIHYAAVYHELYDNSVLSTLLSDSRVNSNVRTIKGKTIMYNNVKLNTKNKTAYQLAHHFLCFGSCCESPHIFFVD